MTMAHKVLLKSLAFLIAGALAVHAENSAATPVPRESEKWKAKHEAINQRVQQGNVDLLWIGDSIVERWADDGKRTWNKYYAPRNAANLGISGDCTEHVLWRLQNGNIEGIRPKLAIVMIGQNNGPHNTAEEIAEGVLRIVDTLRAELPETKILLLSITYRGQYPNEEQPRLQAASDITAKAADDKHVFYLDMHKVFLNADGSIPKKLMSDYEHPSATGFRLWAKTIEPEVARLMGDAPVGRP